MIVQLIYINRTFSLARLSSTRFASHTSYVAGKLNLAEEEDAFLLFVLNFPSLLLQIPFYINRSFHLLRPFPARSASLAGPTSTAAKPGFKEEGEMLCLCILHLLSFPNLLPQKVLTFSTIN